MALALASAWRAWRPLSSGSGADGCAVRRWAGHARLHLAVGRQAITAVIVLGAIWLLNDYRGVPTPVLILAALLLAGMFMATRTAFGRRIYAIGGNLEAARLSGINVERTKLAVFAINGLMVAIAGLILSSRLGAGSPRPATSPNWTPSPPALSAAPASPAGRQRRGRGHGGIYHVGAG
jgi:D-xylose transport system permease protein